MSKNKKIAWILLILVITALCIFGLVKAQIGREIAYMLGMGSPRRDTPDPLNLALEEMISRYQKGEIEVINIAAITSFSWDRLHIFEQYASAWEIDPIVGRSWRDVDSCAYGVGQTTNSDGYSLFVFAQDKTVVYCMVYRRDPPIYVNSFERSAGIPPEVALFVIDKTGTIRRVPTGFSP